MSLARMCLAGLVVACCAACGGGPEANAYVPDAAFVEKLKTQAERLARSELARFNELEEMHQNDVQFEKRFNPFSPGGGVYYKMYRDYTASRVKDIRKRDSYLSPIAFEIEFEYALHATPLHHMETPNSADLAKQDTEFQLVRTSRTTLTYMCDPWGQVIEPRPGLLPRDGVINPQAAAGMPPGGNAAAPVTNEVPLVSR